VGSVGSLLRLLRNGVRGSKSNDGVTVSVRHANEILAILQRVSSEEEIQYEIVFNACSAIEAFHFSSCALRTR
jgi:hypothetical protein